MDIISSNAKVVDISVFPRSISFSFYTPKEIRNLACVEIFCPVFFDISGNVIKGGLCDEKMGLCSKFGFCKFCKGNYSSCPGHSGYIDLPIPVANNFLRNLFFTILKAKCLVCNFLKSRSFELFFLILQMYYIAPKFENTLLKEFKSNENNSSKNMHPEYPKLFSFNVFRNISINKSQKILQKTIKKKICCSKNQKSYHKYGNWVKDISLFLFQCKNSLICPKCAYYNTRKELKENLEDFNLKFFNVRKNYHRFYRKSDSNSNSNWIISPKEKILFNKDKTLKDFLAFQFKEEFEILWKFENDFCQFIWGTLDISKKIQKNNGHHLFYIDTLLIPPTRFRPFNSSEIPQSTNSILGNPQNFYYAKILKANQLIFLTLAAKDEKEQMNIGKKSYSNLEISINNLGNSASDDPLKIKENPIGIRQQLEKKFGIFRMHLMGKRVFHSARSIIVPDPFLKCNEVGVPFNFSNQLTLPEEINLLNFGLLIKSLFKDYKECISLQKEKYFENIVGDKLNINHHSLKYRKRNFLKICYKYSGTFFLEQKPLYGLNRVIRSLVDQDIILINRQPSLHRVSIMSHKIKIQFNSKCIKLNYCNCNSYNADFDGDEMNLHVPQNFFAKTEANLLSICSKQFKTPVNDFPIRGLIQDYILSSVIMTKKDTFINLKLFNQLLSFSENLRNLSEINIYPAILKPKLLWTGKQIISVFLKNFSKNKNLKVLESRTKFSRLSFGTDETRVLVRKGELLRGVIDSSQFGKNKFGILHAYYEINGGEMGDFFLSEMGSILIFFLRIIGYTLGLEDLLLIPKIEKYRKIGIRKISKISRVYSRKFLSLYGIYCQKKKPILKRNFSISFFTRFIFFTNNLLTTFINSQKNHVANLFSRNIENCIPGGLFKKPNLNKFSIITLSGAKGSSLNTNQLSLNLGQTELESNCIPRNIGGKTLPTFFPFDCNISSNGFISSRFITGITQSEFFFHCMAGREGLLDTAVKTSQSGYIQRSLVKHLESVTLSYDHSVRFSKGQINQFIYSRNGCCSMNSDMKINLEWTFQNFNKNRNHPFNIESEKTNFEKGTNLCIFSKKIQNLPLYESKIVKKMLKKNKKYRKIYLMKELLNLCDNGFSELFYKKLALPGDALGILTSQSLGEPCTQMTLNTFHFAGKLASNQKSGISRLKEILLLSSKFPLTPIMSGKLLPTIDPEKFSMIQQRFKPVYFNDLVKCFTCFVEKSKNSKKQIIRLIFLKKHVYKHMFSLKMTILKRTISSFIVKVKKTLISNSRKPIVNGIKPKKSLYLLKNQNNVPKDRIARYKEEDISIKSRNDIIKVDVSYYRNSLGLEDPEFFFKPFFKIKTHHGISNCLLDFREKCLHINGINFSAFWKNPDIIDLKKIFTNDIYGMMITYGIEASRNCLFNELETVFKIQGIPISTKHFDLISDYMTRVGNFRGFNRKGFREEGGFQEITYETAIKYILAASLSGKIDNLTTVSSRLSVGMSSNLGTGCFGIRI